MHLKPFKWITLALCISSVTPETVYPSKMRETEYDYIIVGAGSAGSVIANRLSEELENKVLLLEAGGTPPGISEIPFVAGEQFHTEVDWAYYTEPQEQACLGFHEQRSYHPRGKTLGGSSVTNAMMYVRGAPRDFDEWANNGATGWSYEDVLYYFKKSEDNTDPNLVNNGYHGKGGYLTVSTPTEASPLRESFLDAGKHLGFDVVDYNGPSQLGISTVQFTVRDGLRCSTEKAFLRPVVDRENLDILIHAHVTKILFDQDKRAYAVRFEQNGASHVIKARKEIVVSAGAIASPQILMLSGIGPKQHLEELGIDVVADLPVGENLQDHITHAGQIYLINTTDGLTVDKLWNYKNVGDLIFGKGPLGIPGGIEAALFMNTKYQDPAEQWPDIQITFVPSFFLPPVDDYMKKFIQDNKPRNIISAMPWIQRPQGRGFIKLRSANPYDHPIIDPKYLTVEDDVNRLVEGMKFVEGFMKTPAMQKYNPVRTPEVIPGCENIDTESEEYLRCMVRRLTLTVYHQCGTCRMGDPQDSSTVLDPELRVKGVKGLRVADASVMPLVVSANTNAASIMIGEKAADMIRGRYWDPKLGQIVMKNTS